MKLSQCLSREEKTALRNFALDREAGLYLHRAKAARMRRGIQKIMEERNEGNGKPTLLHSKSQGT